MGDMSVPQMAAVTLKLAEMALSTADGNGGTVPAAEVRYVLGRLALASPETAARCPRVRVALPPEALAVVLSLASARPAMPPAEQQPQTGDSGTRLSTRQAAEHVGVSQQAIRQAAARGSLPGVKSRATGEWSFAANDVKEYARAKRR